MQNKLLNDHTYFRWQTYGTLYGVTRHSFMVISNQDDFVTTVSLIHFRTIYVRMVELALLQRASVLKFSAEVTRLSTLSDKATQKLADDIDTFYKAYIRFVNQMFFREITAQEQGIDLYDLLMDNMRIKEQVKDLDDEIEELHKYATLLDEKSQSRNIGLLTILGSLFLLPSFIVGFYGMNIIPEKKAGALWPLWTISGIIVIVALSLIGVITFGKREKKGIVILLIVLISILMITAIGIPMLLM